MVVNRHFVESRTGTVPRRRRALQRDEEANKRWRAKSAGAVKAGSAKAPCAGFRGRSRVLPLARGGQDLLPEGWTPVLRATLTRDHLSVMGGMTPVGKIYTLVRQESLNGLHSVEFLIHLLCMAGRRLLVI